MRAPRSRVLDIDHLLAARYFVRIFQVVVILTEGRDHGEQLKLATVRG